MRTRWVSFLSLLGLLTAGTVALAGKPGGGGNPPPAPNPAIVYGEHDGTQWNVKVMNADGSNQVVVAPAYGVPPDPSWSPDGQQIVFRAIRTIHVVNSDGTGLTTIVPASVFSSVFDPRWSPAPAPDGNEKIAFAGGLDGSHVEIYLVNTDGTGLVNLTNDPDARDWEATWSPDATRIAVARRPIAAGAGLATEIVVWDLGLDASGEVVVTGETTLAGVPRLDGTNVITGLDWARTEDRLAMSVREVAQNLVNLWIVDLADTAQSFRLNTGLANESDPSWSPDDTKVVFRRDGFGKESKKTGLYVVNADGTGLTSLNAKEGQGPDWKR